MRLLCENYEKSNPEIFAKSPEVVKIADIFFAGFPICLDIRFDPSRPLWWKHTSPTWTSFVEKRFVINAKPTDISSKNRIRLF